MSARTIAIGDIHGSADALAALIDAINPGPADTVVALGDYIDRGPDSRGVLEQLMALGKRCRLVPLLGDHEEMLLDAVRDRAHLEKWLKCGDAAVLRLEVRRPPAAAGELDSRSAPAVPQQLRALLRDGHTPVRARRLRTRPADGNAGRARAALAHDRRPDHAGPYFGQGRRGGANAPGVGRRSRLGLSDLH